MMCGILIRLRLLSLRPRCGIGIAPVVNCLNHHGIQNGLRDAIALAWGSAHFGHLRRYGRAVSAGLRLRHAVHEALHQALHDAAPTWAAWGCVC